MNTCTLVADVENYGYQLTQADGKIKYRGQGGLPDNLISKLKSGKPAVIQYLAAREKLNILASEFNWPVDDLLDWFKDDDDMKDIARWDIYLVRRSVQFYIDNHKQFRRETIQTTNQLNEVNHG